MDEVDSEDLVQVVYLQSEVLVRREFRVSRLAHLSRVASRTTSSDSKQKNHLSATKIVTAIAMSNPNASFSYPDFS